MKSFSDWTQDLADAINAPAKKEWLEHYYDIHGKFVVECCCCGRQCYEADPDWFESEDDILNYHGGCSPRCIP